MNRILTALAAFILMALPLGAQTYPDYSDLYVNDFADLLPPDRKDAVRSTLQKLRTAKGIEFTVVTIDTMGEYGHVGPIEPFATGLFNAWGVGDATRNDGIMLLVSRFDRVMRIELGSGYGFTKDLAMEEVIEGTILPHFRDDDYATGIEKGVTAVILDITGSYPGEYDASGIEKAAGWLRRLLETLGAWVLAILAPIGGLVEIARRRWKRNKPRRCPRDGQYMIRLPEDHDDQFLKDGERTEEELKSVDYDVWQCPKCAHVTIEGYKAWFSRYGACRQCGFRTVEGETTVLRAATTSSEGQKRIDYHCHNCGDEYSALKTIPRISKSSSSSGGSSFGGGSSSGGGASGSW